ncbi:chorismate synthase [Methanonatronarchaeum sp. AMET-Sl]|uniref:chorismate synthase n=1 Tax=Methanonatronarchaeum sp. AMET-Sl TaxID=3037654 RepID=UPI00244E2C36|nr:chorismate synthase [Methanonatronarchaeum sp. AMET-Sl]WGI17466.1 chorismate synthase [Methanonatronarchaeum sp. AMET-Sl]
MSNTFGNLFSVTTFGESHGGSVGAVVDGSPAGLELSEKDIQLELDRRRPGQSNVSTSRDEKDLVKILSGVFKGKTTGTPIGMLVENKDVDSSKYSRFKLRPGHADYTYEAKYGYRDFRGGGRSSGRETVGRVCGGAIAKKLLETIDIEIYGHVKKVGEVESNPKPSQIKRFVEENPVRCGDPEKASQMEQEILRAKNKGDSVGGVVEVIAEDVPPGIGEPVFKKLESELAKAIMSVGAVKGFEIGAGFNSATMLGSESNDPITIENDEVKMLENDAGGVLGGISTGMPIIFRAAIKPTPSINKKQKTINLQNKEQIDLEIEGRHDPCICPRVVPVLESMAALVLTDLSMQAGKLPQDKIP